MPEKSLKIGKRDRKCTQNKGGWPTDIGSSLPTDEAPGATTSAAGGAAPVTGNQSEKEQAAPVPVPPKTGGFAGTASAPVERSPSAVSDAAKSVSDMVVSPGNFSGDENLVYFKSRLSEVFQGLFILLLV